MKPQFSTKVQRSVNLTELRTSLTPYPLWTISLAYEFLRDNTTNNELKQMVGFFLQRKGAFDSFLYNHPDDNAVTAEPFGTGNGATLSFQLTRAFGGFAEPVTNVNGAPVIKVAGVTKTVGTDYSISATGLVTFTAAPTGALTWTGSYYYRVRFLQDEAEFNQFLKKLWDLKKLEFVGCVGNKI